MTILEDMTDPSPHVRSHALALAEGFMPDGNPPPPLWTALTLRTSDAKPLTRSAWS